MFQENDCRICLKTFCCVNCRIYHEEQTHQVNSNCEICIYGRMTIKDASVALLHHIKAAHWPLHCVFCKKVFESLDELIPHEKCSVKLDTMKMQATPRTPVTPVTESNEPSPMLTPFYKSVPDAHKKAISTIAMAATSTPLISKEEISDKNADKITPLNTTDLKFICKSSLKLTGSSNLSDSKKSERRVTFSETPSISESSYKKSKYLPRLKQIKQRKIDNVCESPSDHSYSNVGDEDEMYKTVSSIVEEIPEEQNDENQILLYKNVESDVTADWESALTNCGSDTSKGVESSTNINVALQINVFNGTLKSEDDSSVNLSSGGLSQSSIWSSMTNIVKSVMNNISTTAALNFPRASVKRALPDTGFQSASPSYKRMKLTQLKCRRPIRDISPLYQIRLGKPTYADKSTQTDEILV